MGQYKTGKAVVVNGSQFVIGDADAVWTGITPGAWFAVKNTNVSYDVAAVDQLLIGAQAAHNVNSAYAVGAVVASGGLMYLCILEVPINQNIAATNITYWVRTQGWRVALTANYAGVTGYVQYGLHKDFTANYNLPQIAPGDIETGAIISRGFQLIDDFGLGSSKAVLSLVDDFMSGKSADGQIGQLGWNLFTSNGALNNCGYILAESIHHPGIFRLQSLAVNNDYATLSLFPDNLQKFFTGIMTQKWELTFVFRLVDITSVHIRVGLAGGATLLDPATMNHFAGLRFSTASGDTTFKFLSRSAGVDTVVDTGIAVDTLWHSLRIRCEGDSKIKVRFDSGNEVTISTNIPVPDLAPVATIQTLTTVVKSLHVDYFNMLLKGLVR